jgi:D-sedoheptulose 7-phosphate isomerase
MDFVSSNGNGMSNARGYFAELSLVLSRLPFGAIDRFAEALHRAYQEDRQVLLFGNGGSAALASHMACDLGKGMILPDRHRFRVLSLTDNVPLMTAWANDDAYHNIFAEQIRSLARPRDIAFAISGSGNSPNVLNGLTVAHEMGATTLGIAGFEGGRMKELCNDCVVVPSSNMQLIEDAHLCISHAIFTALRHALQERSPAVAAPLAR